MSDDRKTAMRSAPHVAELYGIQDGPSTTARCDLNGPRPAEAGTP